MRISLRKNENISPYLIGIARKILMNDYGWGAATEDDVASWLGDHKDVFMQAYALASRNNDDDNACVKAGIDAILDDEENAVTDAEIAMSEGMGTPLTEICDALNRYAVARNLPYKADVLDGGNGQHIALHNTRRCLDLSYNKDKDLEVYKATDVVGSPSHTFAHWGNLLELSARLLGIMDRYVKTEGKAGLPAATEVYIRKATDIIAEKLVGSTDEPYEIDKIRAYMDKNGWRWFFNDRSGYFEFTKNGKKLSGSLVPWFAYVLPKDGKYYVGRSLKDWQNDLKALGIMESVGESAYEKLSYEKGHKNSKGEDAPWVIRSHADGRILASFAKKADAEQHLARMKGYADKE